jgi:non-heme chloroperoxidase
MAYLAIAPDQRLYYEHHPAGRMTVVLVHGWGMSGRAWDWTVPRLLEQGISVVTYDQRGCGRSDSGFRDVSIAALGADLVKLCEHLRLDSPVLNGWSLGGAVAVDAAARLDDRLAGLVLTCGATPRYTRTNGFPFGGTPADVEATLAALRADRANFLRTLYFDAVCARPVDDDVKHTLWQIALEARAVADASLGALAQLDQRDALARIHAPSLVVVGGRDGIVAPDIGRFAAQQLRHAELLELPDCGHAPFVEEPSAYHDALVRFLARLPAQDP